MLLFSKDTLLRISFKDCVGRISTGDICATAPRCFQQALPEAILGWVSKRPLWVHVGLGGQRLCARELSGVVMG